MLTKMKNIRKKIKKKKHFFTKMSKMPERMAQGKQQPKFERNPCIRFRDGRTDGGRTTDKFRFHESSRAKNMVLNYTWS